MKRDDQKRAWIQDLHDRQRNIVFPDTALNTGRFYRNLTSGRLTTVQRVGVIIWACAMIVGPGCILPWILAELVADFKGHWVNIYGVLVVLLMMLFGIFLLVKTVFPRNPSDAKSHFKPQRQRHRS